MRNVAKVLGLGTLLLLAGCSNSKWGMIRGPGSTQAPTEVPTAARLVNHLNQTGQQIQSVECMQLDLDCKQKSQMIGLTGKMVCQKPRSFRLSASVVGSQAVDLGSNDQEFWFWISKAEPPALYHCTYQDFQRGNVQLPFPFQPEWVMEALGMGEYGPPESYQVRQLPNNTYELMGPPLMFRGQEVRKVTVFTAAQSGMQVKSHQLRDARGGIICTANIIDSQLVRGVSLPRRVVLSWPDQQIEMKMKLDEVTVNQPIEAPRLAALFTRPTLANVPSYDLAHGPDAPQGQVRRAGATSR